MKKLRLFLAILFALPCCFVFSACSNNNDELLSKIKDLQSQIDTLESSYQKNNNSTLDTYDLYEQAIANDEFEGSFLDFLNENFTITHDSTSLVANKSTMSVVTVLAYNMKSSIRRGSGIIYSLDNNGNAIIVTNYHVTYNTGSNSVFSNYELNLYGQDSTKTITAEFVGGSAEYDLAVLKVSNSNVLKNSNVSAVTLDTNDAKLGTTCLAIGNPNGDGISITRGVVSRDSESVKTTVAGLQKYRRLLRHDAYITNGNSGGGLFDMNGNLIGITNAGETNANHINYAIPSSTIYAVVQSILANCLNTPRTSATTLNLGALYVSESNTSTYNPQTGFIDIVESVIFAEIQETSILKQTNILQSGDEIINLSLDAGEVNEISKDITRTHHVKEFLLKAKAGDILTITAKRNGATISTTLSITANDIISVA